MVDGSLSFRPHPDRASPPSSGGGPGRSEVYRRVPDNLLNLCSTHCADMGLAAIDTTAGQPKSSTPRTRTTGRVAQTRASWRRWRGRELASAKLVQQTWRRHRDAFRYYSVFYRKHDCCGCGSEVTVLLWAKSEKHAKELFKNVYDTIPEKKYESWFEIKDIHDYISKRSDHIAEIAGSM